MGWIHVSFENPLFFVLFFPLLCSLTGRLMNGAIDYLSMRHLWLAGLSSPT